MEKRNYILLYINGKPFKVSGESVFQSLSDYIRYDLQKTGTKVVCAEGDCGSCTVALGTLNNDKLEYSIVNSCIKYLYQLDCCHIITIEGLRAQGTLTVVQEAMMENHGAQCGFCTPGFIVAMSSLYETKDKLTQAEVKDGLTGNLCRCTGYEAIIKSALTADTSKYQKFEKLYPVNEITGEFKKYSGDEILIETAEKKFFKPLSINAAVKFKKENPGTVLVAGGTDIGVQLNKKRANPAVLMSTLAITGINSINEENGILKAGAGVTLAQLESFILEKLPELAKILKVFGSPQIKNAGTIAGNIANASPIADTLPFLFVTGAEIELTGSQGIRTVNINDFYKGYKILDMQADEIITGIAIPLPVHGETLKLYKVSKRKDLDISAFTAAFLLQQEAGTIKKINIAYGGVGPVVLRLPETERFLTGKQLSEENMKAAGKIARDEITPISDVRGTKDFRNLLAANVLMKLYFDIEQEFRAPVGV